MTLRLQQRELSELKAAEIVNRKLNKRVKEKMASFEFYIEYLDLRLD